MIAIAFLLVRTDILANAIKRETAKTEILLSLAFPRP